MEGKKYVDSDEKIEFEEITLRITKEKFKESKESLETKSIYKFGVN